MFGIKRLVLYADVQRKSESLTYTTEKKDRSLKHINISVILLSPESGHRLYRSLH